MPGNDIEVPYTKFQYVEPIRDGLWQGDILDGNVLRGVLEDTHPKLCKGGVIYPYFAVLTQSCDLVKRDTKPKAEYLTLSVVLPIRNVLEREADRAAGEGTTRLGYCTAHKLAEIQRRFERLINNEFPPYFCLHVGAHAPFADHHAVVLPHSYSIRAEDYYEQCLKAKCAQLAPDFQAKIGWLTAYVYGHVGTNEFGDDEREILVKKFVTTAGIHKAASKKELESALQGRTTKDMDETTLKLIQENLDKYDPCEELITAVMGALENLDENVRKNPPMLRRKLERSIRKFTIAKT
ncbi:MAG TPA: hypothetical protein PL033_01870 [Candidatus Brocadiia bacterium]|nr:hypothetical protein [Candidatus Brocadiia bacterium]